MWMMKFEEKVKYSVHYYNILLYNYYNTLLRLRKKNQRNKDYERHRKKTK